MGTWTVHWVHLVWAACVGLTACGGGGSSSDSGSVQAPPVPVVAPSQDIVAGSTQSSIWPRMAAAAVFDVTRTGASDGAVSVSYSTRDGSALAGRDYTASSGTLSWADKESGPKSITVLLGAIAPASSQLGFDVVLSAPLGGSVPGSATRIGVTLDPALTAPASLSQFDLSKWKLDLPVDRNGGKGGVNGIEFASQTISSAQLLNNFADPYFYADSQHRLLFTAPANGAVTSPGVGSDHTRSELREVFSGPGADSNGNWSGNGRLTGACAVLAVAAKSTTAVIAQLRGQAHDLALLGYRPATHDVAVDIYATNASGSSHTVTALAGNVNLGDAITYSLSLNGNVLTATVNGGSRTVAVDASWVGAPLYFKLGAYSVAPNTGNNATDVTMVAYSAFAVSH